MKKKLNENYLGIDTRSSKAFMDPIKLKSLLNLKEGEHEEPKMELTSEQKQAFMEAVAAFAELAPSIYRKHSLDEITYNLSELIEAADHLTLAETEDWFDRVTVQRHMKQLGESFKVFEKTAKEISTLQQRLESAYEDIGNTLGKYYDIKEIMTEEESDYQKHFMKALKKFKIKTPADLETPVAKKKFFNYIDKTYVAKDEKPEAPKQ